MNKQRRKELTRIYDAIDSLADSLEFVEGEEQDAFDNLPESLQDGSRGEQMQAAIDNMSESASALRDVLDTIDEARS